jgi:hypothetical protein
MKKQIVVIVLSAVVILGTAPTLFAQGQPTGGYPPVAGGAGGYPGPLPGSITVQTQSGKTMQLRTMKIRGHKMIVVPMEMSCDLLRYAC